MWHINRNTVLSSVLLMGILGACNDDTEVSHTDNSRSISFKAVAASLKETRAVEEYGSTYGNEAFSVTASHGSSQHPNVTRGSMIEYYHELDKNSSFGVFAFETTGGFAYAGNDTPLMDNQEVTLSVENDTCAYMPVRYWTNNNYTFMAYAPYIGNTPNDRGLALSRIAGENNYQIAYQAPTDVTKQPDLMVGKMQKDRNLITTNAGNNVVDIQFEHTLAAISATVRANSFRIESIVFANIYNKGDLIPYDENNSDGFTWTPDASSWGDFNLGLNLDEGQSYITVEDREDVTARNGHLMMIPQTLRDDAEVRVTLTNNEGANRETRTFKLKNPGLPQSWKAGVNYVYNITIVPYFRLDVDNLEYTYEGGTETCHVYSELIEGDGTITQRAWTVDTSTVPKWLTGILTTGTGNTSYPVTAGKQTKVEGGRDYVMQHTDVVANQNLASGGETANCYLVNAAGTYYFPANVMGVGASGCFNLFNYKGEETTDAAIDLTGAKAELIWQDQPGLITKVHLDGDNIHFTAAGNDKDKIKQGNALIGIKNAEGTIMWSWHIWLTNITMSGDNLATLDFHGNPNTILRYELGFTDDAPYYPERVATVKFTQAGTGQVTYATFVQHEYAEAKSDSYSCTGYQWGRKDPFSLMQEVNSDGSRTLYDIDGNVIYYRTQSESVPVSPAATNPVFEDCLITQPMTFVKPGDRMLNYKTQGLECWGNSTQKSIYDPCPPGFQVPARNTFAGIQLGSVNSGDDFCVLVDPDGKEIMRVYACGYYYGRKGLNDDLGLTANEYGIINRGILVWYNSPVPSSSYIYNRWTVGFNMNNSHAIQDNSGQSMCHSYGIIPAKRR